ncbi:hypothetical protein V8E54_010838 [Elaphomyces granulatus]
MYYSPDAKIEILYEDQSLPFAHEAGVYIPETGDLWITSNQYQAQEGGPKEIRISRVSGVDSGEINVETIEPDPAILSMPNGGVNYQDGVLFCAQGNLNLPGGLVYMEKKPPYTVHRLVEGFLGRDFNSLNDVVVHSDGSIWFTDPIYGYEQGIRPQPRLPNQVYRFNPADGGIRAVADGFGRPNGICFSPDENIVYVTDTAWIHGDGSISFQRPSTIYAFDVATYSEQPFLTNRRLFAFADVGIPDGIKCDMQGNVYSGCGDGVNVWSPGGVLLGKILIPGGVSNFCFGPTGTLFLLNEHKLYKIQLGTPVVGALLKLPEKCQQIGSCS